ncbi:MAG TPA: hypothetical protein VI357_09085 [Mycobacteriales bacterium]
MFRTLARLYVDPTLTTAGSGPFAGDPVFTTHPVQLSRWLEQVFAHGGIAQLPSLGSEPVPVNAEAVLRLQLPAGLRDRTADVGTGTLESGLTDLGVGSDPPTFDPNPPAALGTTLPLVWDHLVYAYLIESTGILPVFAEVVRRFSVGETLEAPAPQTLAWARATEELFFRDPPLFHVGGLTSQLRPDAAVNRRNAYWRMFGWDLPHPGPDGQPWKRDVGAAANTRFLELIGELLRQVWLGFENQNNSSGANPTDDTYLGYVCQTLGEMLRMRRRGGMLAREEFSYVTMMSWFHLTVETDTSVVRDLRAVADVGGNAADRLAGIASRVGMTLPRQTRELFDLADLLSPILWFIELGRFNSAAQARTLYLTSGGANPIAEDMLRLIDLWQSATGARVKDLSVVDRPGPAVRAADAAGGAGRPAPARPIQPTRLPAGPTLSTIPAAGARPASVNGSGATVR